MTKNYQKEIPWYFVRGGSGDYGTVALDVGQRCVTRNGRELGLQPDQIPDAIADELAEKING